MLKIDMHVHTEFSPDAFGSIPEIVTQAQKRGLDGIAITDHNTVDGALKALEFVNQKGIDLIIVPGIEISTQGGHLIALGVVENIEAGLSVEETLREIKKLGGISVVPHPFHPFRNGIWKFSKFQIDAIEVYNAKYILGVGNFLAKMIREKLSIPETGGSDSHNPEMLGYGYTVIDAERDHSSVLEALKNGLSRASGERIPVGVYLEHVKKRVQTEW